MPTETPAAIWPVASNQMTAGTHTSAAPSAGTMDRTAITVAQKAAPGTPTTAKLRPARPPCRAPMTSDPLMVARVTETKRSTSLCSSAEGRGNEVEDTIEDGRAAGKEEVHRVQHDEELEEKVGGAARGGGQAVDQHRARALGQLAGEGDDALAVGQELTHQRDFEQAGLDGLDQVQVAAHPSGRRLRNIHGLRDDQPQEADGGRHQDDQHQEKGGDRGGPLAPPHPGNQPQVERAGHAAEHRGQQDGDQELADHHEEED